MHELLPKLQPVSEASNAQLREDIGASRLLQAEERTSRGQAPIGRS
jgi:hypothetical protein